MPGKGTSIRLDDELRSKLDAIAEREIRTLSNQVTYFLKFALGKYEAKEKLTWVNGRYYDDEDLRYHMVQPGEEGYDPESPTLLVRPAIGKSVLSEAFLHESDAESESGSN